ncbi:MAG: PKD domain-containing protein, partial [Promethearchaeota archaeon]
MTVNWTVNGNWTEAWVLWGDATAADRLLNTTTSCSHSYSQQGKYNVILFVKDKWGNTDSKSLSQQIIIKNNAPTFNIGFSNDHPGEDELFNIFVDNLEDSDYDIQHKVHSYIFDFGDGSEQVQTNENYTTHKYENAGNYPVTITAIDDQNALSQKTQLIEVINEPPTASFKLGAEIPSVFPFSNDIIGRIPFGWKEHTPAAMNAIKVVDNKDSFMKVLEITGNPGYELPAIKTYVGNQYFGTIEYYFRSTNVNEKVGYMALYSGSSERLAI